MEDEQAASEERLRTAFGMCFDDRLAEHIAKANAALTQEEFLALTTAENIGLVLGGSAAQIALAAHLVHEQEYEKLVQQFGPAPALAALKPGEELQEQFKQYMLEVFRPVFIPLEEYYFSYNDFVASVSDFNRTSLSKGMSWSEVIGGVAGGMFGPLGAIMGGMLGSLASDKYQLSRVRQGAQKLNELLNKVVVSYWGCEKAAWVAFIDLGYCTERVRADIERS
ncbi:MAG: hypothetical protein LC104_10080 [Bacteroidales bacterium]|nr:hypothetical protein [Bacteroidales bacterium]